MSDEILTTWKQIGQYFNVCGRTARKMHKARPMPLIQVPGSKTTIMVSTEELRKWRKKIPLKK